MHDCGEITNFRRASETLDANWAPLLLFGGRVASGVRNSVVVQYARVTYDSKVALYYLPVGLRAGGRYYTVIIAFPLITTGGGDNVGI